VRLYEDPAEADAEAIVRAIVRGLTPRTRVVAITWVHSSTGVKLPLAAIAEALRGRALLCVDAVHGFGAEPADLEALGCDAFVSGCHKWLGGPRGTGLAWARPAAWRRVEPTIPSFSRPTPGGRHTPGGFHAFEHRWALAQAFAFQAELGQEKIAGRIHALAARLKDGLAEIDGVRLITPRDEAMSAGLVCLEVRRRTPESVVEALRSEHGVIASVTPYAQRYVRLGTGLGVLEDDVDAAVEAVATIAA
jgi:selenocysteine lyase/cysteine desulfurase